MYETKKTIYHTHLELQRSLRNGFTPLEHSTLNEKFDVALEETLPTDVYPDIYYIAIGRGGHRGRLTADNATIIDILEHDPRDAALYEHIPFALRPINNDFSDEERLNYGLRTIRTYNGQEYYAYYLKRIDLSRGYPEVDEIIVEDGETTSTAFVPTPALLTPTPLPLATTRANAASGRHINVSSTLSIELTQADLNLIVEACEIIYGDVAYATISELATVSAIPSEYTSTLGVTEVTYIEAMSAQICNHIPINLPVQRTTNGVEFLFSLGHTSVRIR